ncbi:hypothetical protein FUAX_41310 (plasmid) [Fulvitalea axinellae]|uniref:Uncharacterized protein n=1 Tax=Fulvitalea axinellae TaxID=1182444 RepID=A0AAU9CHQ5_9BACT|nr:hypothetical protein FUAX_41310 [Fulvitalea axinellae]
MFSVPKSYIIVHVFMCDHLRKTIRLTLNINTERAFIIYMTIAYSKCKSLIY